MMLECRAVARSQCDSLPSLLSSLPFSRPASLPEILEHRKSPLPVFGRYGAFSVFWEISLFLGSRASSKNVFSSRALSPSSWRDYILKCLLVTSNLLFTVLGLVTLVVGLWGLINKESFAQEKISGIGTDPMLLFTFLGFILALLSLMGCVGALRENMCLLRNFSAVVLVLVVAQVLAVVVLYSLQGQIEDYLHSGMLAAMVRYQDDLDLRFITDEIQTGLQCCGADTYRDWGINVYFNCSAPGVQACGVPPSCCIDPLENGTVWNSQCGVGAQKLDEFSAQSVIFLGGCMGSISRWIEQHSGVIVTVVIILLAESLLMFRRKQQVHATLALDRDRAHAQT
uniref:Tetraspanin-10 n=1 Tax=Sinocyclocheilus anshuiensis TaxID=1608454 RepID=A0A671RVZ0_9TELE